MLAAPLLLLLYQSAGVDVSAFDRAARARDVQALQKLAAPVLADRLTFLRRNGAYDTGRFGWRAHALRDVAGSRTYVVFSTPLTSEDISEQVFEARGGRLVRYIDEVDDLGVRIRHNRMSVSFDLSNKRTSIDCVTTFEATRGQSFLIRMSPNYKVSRVQDARGKAVAFRQAGGVVALPTPGNGRFDYRIVYQAVVDLPNYAGSITTQEANLTNDYWYPMIARRPSTHETTIAVPRNWTAVTQGKLLEDRTSGNRRVFRYRMDLPAIYYSLTAAPFQHTVHRKGSRSYHVWAATMSAADRQVQAEINPLIIDTLSTFGAYPFDSWGSLISKQYGGGALEAYSYATYGEGWLPDEDGHEPAHTWFGGIINNTYLRSLWNESFASFADAFYRREAALGSREERRLAFIADPSPDPAYQSETVARGGVYAGPVAVSLGYGKGSKVLQVLEHELGTELLTRCIRNWLAKHPKGEPGEWEHFEAAVDATTGKSYRWFFDQWLRRKGWPDLDVQDVAWSEGFVTGRFVQKGQPYRLKLDVMLQYPSGRREYRVATTDSPQFRIESPEKPSVVSFDPWLRILRRVESNEWAVSIERSSSPLRLWAEPGREPWMKPLREGKTPQPAPPTDPAGWLLIASPETSSLMAELCRRVGFKVAAGKLTYDGTTVDLASGGAIAVVDLDGGKRCMIALGQVKLAPHLGRARLAVVDGYGRFLRGVTEPKTSGFLTASF